LKSSTETVSKMLADDKAARAAQSAAITAKTEADLKSEWGKQYDAEYQVFQRGAKTYATPGLIKELQEAGLGSSKEVVKLFNRLGQLVREDSAVGGSGKGAKPKSLEERMYPTG